jgi:hypothetical protein
VDLPKRFWDRVNQDGPLFRGVPCWLWTAGVDRDGYGRFYFEGKNLRAHKFAYESLVGSIPEGLHLDHLCRARSCVNPAHLEPVTRKENILRGEGPTAVNARRTQCANGHPLDSANTYYRKDGQRNCRPCSTLSVAKSRAKQKERMQAGV